MNNEILSLKLLEDLSAAVSFYFINDHISPSVLVSTLKNGKIYTSIVRYGNFDHIDYSGVKGKLVVCKAVENSLLQSLKSLSNAFLLYTKFNKRQINPLEKLHNTLRKIINKSDNAALSTWSDFANDESHIPYESD